jgi:hypothetical protein
MTHTDTHALTQKKTLRKLMELAMYHQRAPFTSLTTQDPHQSWVKYANVFICRISTAYNLITAFSQIPSAFLERKWRPKIGACGLNAHKHWWHCCILLCDNLPSVLAYPSNGKCVTSAYTLNTTKWSQHSGDHQKA